MAHKGHGEVFGAHGQKTGLRRPPLAAQGPPPKPKGRGYSCGSPTGRYLAAGKELRYTFEFRVESPGDLRPGSVTTMYREGDTRLEDNTARVEVAVS